MATKQQSRYILFTAATMVPRSMTLFVGGIRVEVADGAAGPEDVGQAVLHLVAEIVVGFGGGAVSPLHLEQGVDVFQREDNF